MEIRRRLREKGFEPEAIDQALGSLGLGTQALFSTLADAGIARDELQIAWDFNTASSANNTRWLEHMRDTAFELTTSEMPGRRTLSTTSRPSSRRAP